MREQLRSARVSAVGVLAVVSIAVLAAGCGGGSKASSVASLGTTTSAASTALTPTAGSTKATKPSTAALATCLRSHGVQTSLGSGGGATNGPPAIQIAGLTISGTDPQSPQFQAAMQACHKFLPGGGPPTETPAQKAQAATAMASFAACMRKNGVANFPDPNGQGTFSLGSLNSLDQNSPLFRTAYKACVSLMPRTGPQVRFGG